MKDKRSWLIIAGAVAVLVMIVLELTMQPEEAADLARPSVTQTIPSEGIEETTLPEQETDYDEPLETTSDTQPSEQTGEPTGETEQTTAPTESATQQPQPTRPQATEADPYIDLPYTIPETSLVIDQINPYNGVFLEDGSDAEANNVTAIVLINKGTTCAEYVNITLYRDGQALNFVASALAAGATTVVMESSAAGYVEGDYHDCSADVAYLDALEMSEDLVMVEETEDGSLRVTNISGEDIPCVRVFYKFYMYDLGVYVGGITYSAKLVDLPAGGEQAVTPSHYAAGYSKVVQVRTYDTAD